MSEIFDILGRLLDYTVEKPSLSLPKSNAAANVKLAHSSEVVDWKRIPSYEEFDGCSLSEYHDRNNEISHFSSEIKDLLKSYKRRQELCTSDPVEYQSIEINVPGDIFRRDHIATLPKPMHDDTTIHTSDGGIEGNQLIIRKSFRSKTIRLTYSCPSSEAYKDEIREIDQELREAPQGDKWKLNECINSVYTQPVLFISHRWEDPSHPDPNGTQLKKLARLKDCFIMYDYFSFPQNAENEVSRASLKSILKDMTSLICNVIILRSDDYTERGWCLYEYIIATMKEELICDEIGAPAFLELRDLVSTQIPPSFSIKGDTIEAWLHNAKGRRIVEMMNAILPGFISSRFTVEQDQELVRELLVEGLLAVLPSKQTHTPYIGWQPSNWRREEVERAFKEPIKPQFEHSPIEFKPKKLAVFDDVDSAVAGKYIISREPLPSSEQGMEIRRWELMGGKHE